MCTSVIKNVLKRPKTRTCGDDIAIRAILDASYGRSVAANCLFLAGVKIVHFEIVVAVTAVGVNGVVKTTI